MVPLREGAYLSEVLTQHLHALAPRTTPEDDSREFSSDRLETDGAAQILEIAADNAFHNDWTLWFSLALPSSTIVTALLCKSTLELNSTGPVFFCSAESFEIRASPFTMALQHQFTRAQNLHPTSPNHIYLYTYIYTTRATILFHQAVSLYNNTIYFAVYDPSVQSVSLQTVDRRSRQLTHKVQKSSGLFDWTRLNGDNGRCIDSPFKMIVTTRQIHTNCLMFRWAAIYRSNGQIDQRSS